MPEESWRAALDRHMADDQAHPAMRAVFEVSELEPWRRNVVTWQGDVGRRLTTLERWMLRVQGATALLVAAVMAGVLGGIGHRLGLW